MAWTYNTSSGTPTDGPTLAAIALTFTSIALVAVCLRLYVRAFLIKAIGYGKLSVYSHWEPD